MDRTSILAAAVLAGLAAAVIAINIAYRRRRARMTPEQQTAADEAANRDLQVW